MTSTLVRVSAASAALCALFAFSAAQASDNKIALIPGGPHPYFQPWQQAAADAQKDFGIATECGMSRQRTPELVEKLFAIHAEVAQEPA